MDETRIDSRWPHNKQSRITSKFYFIEIKIKTIQYSMLIINKDLMFRGNYKLEKKLGAGTFGEVYIANDNTSGQEVVVKIGDTQNQKDIKCWRVIEYSFVLIFILFSISIKFDCSYEHLEESKRKKCSLNRRSCFRRRRWRKKWSSCHDGRSWGRTV